MMKSWIIKIIKEELDLYNGEQSVSQIQKDISYLQSLTIVAVNADPKNMSFKFVKSKNDNDIIVTIKRSGIGWGCDLRYSNKLKHANGGDLKWGPFTSYEELVYELNKKLTQNPLLDSTNLGNDYSGALNKEVITLSKSLMSMGNDLKSVPSGDLEDLKDVYKTLKGLEEYSDDDLIRVLKDKFKLKYSGLVNTLNKIYQIKYYKQIQFYKIK